MNWKALLGRDSILLALLIIFGAVDSYVDQSLHMDSILIEFIYTGMVTTIFVFCMVFQYRYPEIKQFGWSKIVLGIVFLWIGSVVDILDDRPTIALIQSLGFDFDRSWGMAFMEKIVGNTAGISLFAFGFLQWVPWMIETRRTGERLNLTLSQANQQMSRVLVSLDEHVESERLTISRELHDDVAQQLTFINFQTQICAKQIDKDPAEAKAHLKTIGHDVSETLKSVRQISRNLRPESLYALGLIPALEQFLEKLRQQQTATMALTLKYIPLAAAEGEAQCPFESRFNERELLHLFRLLQEGVRNAMKHSKANEIQVLITESPAGFQLSIIDDGVGLPWEVMPSDEALVQQGHLGVVGMKERVKELSGTYTLSNRYDAKHQKIGAMMEIVINK